MGPPRRTAWHVMSRLVTPCIVSRETLLALLLGFAAGACGRGTPDESKPAFAAAGGQLPGAAELRADADTLRLSAGLRAATTHADAAIRALATELIGRLEGEAVIPMLELALGDRERGIRLDAARGLARHATDTPSLREAQVLGALAAARDGEERAELIGLLADVAVSASSAAFELALRSMESGERAAGCSALQRLASRGRPLAAGPIERALELLADDQASVVRACAAVLAEPVARETLSESTRERGARALQSLVRGSDRETAAFAVAGLANLLGRDAVPVLQSLVGSREPRIAIESVRALRKLASVPVVAELAQQELQRVASTPPALGRSSVLLELLAALEAHPDQPEAAEVAELALRKLGALAASSPPHALLERAVLHCAAARLADAARHWPKELLTCGHDQMPGALRDAWIADAFARVEDSDELRAVQLGRLFQKGSVPVRIAVLRGAATLPVKAAAAQLKLGLRDPDPRVVAAAADVIGSRPSLRDADEASRIAAADLLAVTADLRFAPETAAAWLRAARAVARSGPIKDAPGSTERAGSVPAAEPKPQANQAPTVLDPALIARVTQLARHPARALREPARALLSEWEAHVPEEGELDSLAAALAADRMPDPASVFHVKLTTTAGPIELELDAARAPVSVVRFLELARSGALDGLLVADRSAGRAVAFAPAPSQENPALRHEDTHGTVERGSVLLQDHGRDAVGPGFALILARTPNLDRRAVQLGTITEGLAVADALTPADSILEAHVSIAAR